MRPPSHSAISKILSADLNFITLFSSFIIISIIIFIFYHIRFGSAIIYFLIINIDFLSSLIIFELSSYF